MIKVNTANIVNATKSHRITFLPGFIEVQSLQYKVIEKIANELKISKFAVYNRLRGVTKIREIEKPVIERVFAEVVPSIDPWTGDRISTN
jgi:hypothetical protein